MRGCDSAGKADDCPPNGGGRNAMVIIQWDPEVSAPPHCFVQIIFFHGILPGVRNTNWKGDTRGVMSGVLGITFFI